MRIKDLGNTATDFASDDYIALDGATNGSRKMKNDSLLKATARNALTQNANPANFPKAFSYEEQKQGYYNTSGSFSSNVSFLAKKFNINGSKGLTIRSYMFGSMAVCEFDENDVFIKSHYLSDPNYDSISFLTDANCKYIWASTYVQNSPDVFVFANSELETSRFLDYVYNGLAIDEIANSEEYGYYNTAAVFVSSSTILTLEFSVEPNTHYCWVGDIFAQMTGIELDSNDLIIKKHANPENPNETKRVDILTLQNTTKIKISSRITKNYIKPFLFKLSKSDISNENIISSSEEGVGYYGANGVYNSNTSFRYKKFAVNGSRHLKVIGNFYGTLRICEFDKNGNFICSHYKSGTYYDIEFLTAHNCAYVYASQNLESNIDLTLYDLGKNIAPYPRIFYGVEGIQKNIYFDRFGIQHFGMINVIPDPNEDNQSYTRRNNRLEFNVDSSSNVNVNVWPSVCGKSLYGDDLTPFSSAIVKFKSAVNPSAAKNILWVGDSISDYQNTAKYARQFFDSLIGGVAPTFVGTRHTTGTPDESYAGESTYWLLRNNSSPFRYNNAVDFAHYNSVIGVSGIDVCVMAMGFNDATRIAVHHSNTLADYKIYYKEFIEKITEANPSIKIVWVLCPFESMMEKGRNSNAHREGAVDLRNLVIDLSYEYSNVIVSDAFYCIDAINGYDLTEIPIASVYSSLNRTQKYCSDPVHPTALGCKEWGENVIGAIIEAFGL